MVLSNKKIKQKLRALTAETIVASEAEKNPGNSQDVYSNDFPDLRAIQAPLSQKPRLSKRVIRRQRAPKEKLDIIENGEVVGDATAKKQNPSELEAGEVQEKAKRKRDESEASEELVKKKIRVKGRWKERGDSELARLKLEREIRKLNRKKNEKKNEKKKEKKKKPKKQGENGEVKEEGVEQNERGATGERVTMTNESIERKDIEVSDKIYVGGIPYYSTEDDIRSYFESCGTITGIDCRTFPDTGKFRGIAIITFKTEAAAKRGLALDGSDMGGLFLKIQPFKSSKVSKLPNFSPIHMEGYNRIYIGNLSWDVAEDDLRNLFADCTIESVRFGEDKETGEFKGYAHVDFDDTLSLNKALKLDQKVVFGRPVKISYAVPKKGSVVTSFKTPPKDDQVSAVDEILVTAKTESTAVSSDVNISSEANANVGAKIRRRTCYECGERGHISSLCPKKKADDSINPDQVSAVNETLLIAKTEVNAVSSDVNISLEENANVSAKIRRRTCYECGERGHISSLCPKTKTGDSINPDKKKEEFKGYGRVDFGDTFSTNSTLKLEQMRISCPVPNKENDVTNFKAGPKDDQLSAAVGSTSIETSANAVVSSKIRRRTCYECGKRGHISSLCPEKKEDNLASQDRT